MSQAKPAPEEKREIIKEINQLKDEREQASDKLLEAADRFASNVKRNRFHVAIWAAVHHKKLKKENA